MGQAKRRGDYETRKAQGIERHREEAKQRNAARRSRDKKSAHRIGVLGLAAGLAYSNGELK